VPGPRRLYGLDVTLHAGERHVGGGSSHNPNARDLGARGVPTHQRTMGRSFRDFVALTAFARGEDEAWCERLRAQGGIVLMCDGLQFEDRSPVLYLAWDALSGEPLFGERKLYRGKEDLVPLLEGVRDMDVPVIGTVTDKQKGLVPTAKDVFPGVPYPSCHSHLLRSCAKPLEADTRALGQAARRRADEVRRLGRQVAKGGDSEAEGADEADGLSEQELVRQRAELVQVNSRVSGKAPLKPPELNRHERIEQLRAVVDEARKSGARSTARSKDGPCSTS